MVLKDQRFRHRRRHFLLIVQCRQALRPIRGASETKRSQRSPSRDDTDVAVWRRVSSSVVLVARCRAAPAPARGADPRRRQHRPFATNKRSPPTNDRRRPPRGGRPLPLRAPHRRLAQLAHPAGRSRMLIALHRLAPVKASDAISPLNAVVEPGCCRTPPPSWRRAASAIISAAPSRARARFRRE